MHSVLFNLKRAYYRSLRVPREKLREYGLTPARFDVLHAIYKNAARECFRADLVAVIGTVKSNIWRLCDALEKLQLAKPDWECWRIIKLTPFGIAVIEEILAKYGDEIEEVVDACAEAYAQRDARKEKAPRPTKPERLRSALLRIRTALDDKHLFDIYADDYRKKLWEIRVIPRAQKYFGA